MSGKQRNVQHGMQGVFVFVLLGMFALLATLMVLLGAQMYRNTVDRTTRNNEDRMLGAYVRGMVRAEDAAGAVTIEEHGGVTALAMREWFEGEEYVTWLYCHQGQLYECFTALTEQFNPDSGTAICPARRFAPRLEDGLLTVELTDGNGRADTVRVALRCAQ